MPALIGAITLAGRRWGPAVAGWLSGFPIVTGPILLFVALEQGPQFAATTATGALAGGIAWMTFALSYAWAALYLPWYAALFLSLCGWFAVGVVLVLAAPTFAWIVGLVAGAVLLVPHIFPRFSGALGVTRSASSEIFVRMAAGGLLTIAVTRFSSTLGPAFSGLFAVFPVMGIVLAAFSHRASGKLFTIHLLRGMVSGFYGFTVFCLTLALYLAASGIAAGFLLALGLSLTVHFAVLWFTRRVRLGMPTQQTR